MLANPRLKTLDYMYKNLRLDLIRVFSTNTTLTSLQLNRCNIGDYEVKLLSENKTLTHLDLDHNEFGDKGVAYLMKNTVLRSLCIGRNNKITQASILMLANNTTLTSLNLAKHMGSFSNSVPHVYNPLFSNKYLLTLHIPLCPKSNVVCKNTTILNVQGKNGCKNTTILHVRCENKTHLNLFLLRNRILYKLTQLKELINHINIESLSILITEYASPYDDTPIKDY